MVKLCRHLNRSIPTARVPQRTIDDKQQQRRLTRILAFSQRYALLVKITLARIMAHNTYYRLQNEIAIAI